MHVTEQAKNFSVLAHGFDVLKHFKQLKLELFNGNCQNKILAENSRLIIEKLLSNNIIETYCVFHDCGKPYCLTIDDSGRRHFNDHAVVSKITWDDHRGDEIVSRLIGFDMMMHTMSADSVDEFSCLKESATLMLVSYAEVYSNATMFGGIESDNFKIKLKRLNSRSKKIIDVWEKKNSVAEP